MTSPAVVIPSATDSGARPTNMTLIVCMLIEIDTLGRFDLAQFGILAFRIRVRGFAAFIHSLCPPTHRLKRMMGFPGPWLWNLVCEIN